jgi:hypothetical protein
MNNKRRWMVAGIICVFCFALICSNPVFADEITITGIINDTYQIVTEGGMVYEVEDTDMGNEMLNHVGKTVEATGNFVEEDGVKSIKVESYKILEKTES